ncbi:hypothetical protein KBJ98_03290 [Flavobacterium sp. F-328]|uniref:Uncharacterized protein n=1 Tax=Flavobacterium erciyesense TaxID=2825842 RepID=A0ABS5D126_9FLAO|nr:hypothetical protein [Flavobacterium erciyesense]MBQ0907723.1 hypothetical protein [Flavobacterium erciyesense]
MTKQLGYLANNLIKLLLFVLGGFSIRLIPYIIENYFIEVNLDYVKINKSDINGSFIFGCFFGCITFIILKFNTSGKEK